MDARDMKVGDYVSIPIDIGLYNEFVRRSNSKCPNLAAQIENLLINYLDEKPDGDFTWSLDDLTSTLHQVTDDIIKRCGSAREGYQWQTLFLPNGTRLRMIYQGEQHFAEVQHRKIVYEGKNYSPSKWASVIANNTARNAWRDIWICHQGIGPFELADTLRRRQT
jgi:hypothetical protein